MSGEGGVVTAAVLHVENQRHVEHLRLEVGVFPVGTQQREDDLRRGHGRLRAVDVKTVLADIVVISVVAVHAEHRKYRNQLDALAQHVVDRCIVRILVVAEQCQDRARDGVHHILTRRFENDVADKVLRQRPVLNEQLAEIHELFLLGQLAEEQEVNNLLKAEAVVSADAVDDIVDVVAAVIQLAVTGNQLSVYHFVLLDGGNVGQTRQNALAVDVAQTALDVELAVERSVDGRI